MRRFATGLIVATMVLAACGGSSKSSTGSTNTTAGNGTGATTGTTASGGSSGGGSSDISKAKIKITFTETGSDSSGGSTLTIGQDGNGKSFFSTTDTSTDSTADASSTSTIYSLGTSNVECTGTGSTAQCTTLPAAEASIATTITTAFTTIASLTRILGGGDKSSETIAGRDADCVKYKASDVIGKLASLPLFKDSDTKASDYDPSDTATICVDKQTGFPLKFSGTKKGAVEDSLEATAVSEPSDSDFTPPVTPVTVPNITLPGGSTIPGIGG